MPFIPRSVSTLFMPNPDSPQSPSIPSPQAACIFGVVGLAGAGMATGGFVTVATAEKPYETAIGLMAGIIGTLLTLGSGYAEYRICAPACRRSETLKQRDTEDATGSPYKAKIERDRQTERDPLTAGLTV